jgi:hypothetical protein
VLPAPESASAVPLLLLPDEDESPPDDPPHPAAIATAITQIGSHILGLIIPPDREVVSVVIDLAAAAVGRGSRSGRQTVTKW